MSEVTEFTILFDFLLAYRTRPDPAPHPGVLLIGAP